jgi:Alpha-L-fucosidase
MATDWLSQDLWRAHVSWLTPPWVGSTEEGRRDFDAAQWLDVMEAGHYRTLIFYVKHHDGFCAYPSRYSPARPERDFLGECVAEVRRRGLRILCYYSTFIDEVTGNEHPDWQVLARDGTPARVWSSSQWPGAYCCLNNPGYRDLVLGQLAELRDGYSPDGFWMDVFEPMADENCFCPSCRERYRQETGGDLLETQGSAWYESCVVDLMERIREIADGSDRPCVVTANTGKRIPALDAYCDLLTHEAFTSTMISALGRAFRPLGKPFETTCRLYSAVGTWAIRGADRVLLESMAAVVHGGACCQELSPTHTGRITDEAARRVAEVGSYIRGIEGYLVGTEPVLDAALVQAEGAYGVTSECPAPGGWDTVLPERDIPFAYVYPDADLSPYRLVILDGRAPMGEALAAKVADYVRQGGNLIVEGEAAAHGTPAGAVLAEVLGLSGMSRMGDATRYISGPSPALAHDIGADNLVVEGQAYRVTLNGAEALAVYRYEFADRTAERRTYRNMPPAPSPSDDPVISLNPYGRGRALFIACALTTGELRSHRYRGDDAREYPTQLAANLARHMIAEPLLRDTTPAAVEVVVNRQSARHVVHLLNHYAGGPYFDNRRGLLRLADIRLSINTSRIGPVASATEVLGAEVRPLPVQREGQWLEVVLPTLSVHGLVVLEP